MNQILLKILSEELNKLEKATFTITLECYSI